MREIKFRGKRIENGEWVYGDIIRHYENQRRFIACDQSAFTYMECGISRLVSENFYEVDPSTVSQYTGLKDKNGKKIWEKDIVKIEAGYGGDNWYKEETEVVEWENEEGCFYVNTCKDGLWNNKAEVIGNIYDNPELLEVK